MTSNHLQAVRVNPNISTDCVIFGFDFEELKVLLIRRESPHGPLNGQDVHNWALPGDLILENESLDDAANRVLQDLTGLNNIYLEQFRAFGDPERVSRERDRAWLASIREHPEARVITVAYYSLVKLVDFEPQPHGFAGAVDWIPIDEVPQLAFDHNDILNSALDALKQRLRRRPIGFELLPPKFTLGQLQKLYESILRVPLDKRNFRKKMLKKGILVQLDEKQRGVPHKPAQYYRFDQERYGAIIDGDFDFAPAV